MASIEPHAPSGARRARTRHPGLCLLGFFTVLGSAAMLVHFGLKALL